MAARRRGTTKLRLRYFGLVNVNYGQALEKVAEAARENRFGFLDPI
jgi:hypothetical protein